MKETMKERYASDKQTISEFHKHCEQEGYIFHHTAFQRGYIRVGGVYYSQYNGRFGSGLILHTRSNQSNQYHTISYYIKKQTK